MISISSKVLFASKNGYDTFNLDGTVDGTASYTIPSENNAEDTEDITGKVMSNNGDLYRIETCNDNDYLWVKYNMSLVVKEHDKVKKTDNMDRYAM